MLELDGDLELVETEPAWKHPHLFKHTDKE